MVPGSVVLSEVTSSALFVSVLQALKSKFPEIKDMPPWMLRLLSISFALISVIIIGYEWAPNYGGGGTLTLTIPSFAAGLTAIWKWAEQYALNEVVYRTAAKPALPTPKGPVEKPASAPPIPPSKWEQK